MLAFSLNRPIFRKKEESRSRPTSAERKLAYGVDHRTKRVKKTLDVFRDADDRAEEAMMNPPPSPAFRAFFRQFARPHYEPTEQRMDPGWPSASGARLALLL